MECTRDADPIRVPRSVYDSVDGKSQVASLKSRVSGLKTSDTSGLAYETVTCDLRLETCDYLEAYMTKSNLLDRLNHELENIGRRAQAALDEGKLQIELLRVRRKQDNAARDLGLLIHRRERGGEAEPRRIDALLLRLDDLASDISRLEQQIAEARQQRATQTARAPSPEPAETSAPTVP
jgi:chromosome segregation ATPase